MLKVFRSYPRLTLALFLSLMTLTALSQVSSPPAIKKEDYKPLAILSTDGGAHIIIQTGAFHCKGKDEHRAFFITAVFIGVGCATMPFDQSKAHVLWESGGELNVEITNPPKGIM
jgi:hypothetical protein